MSGRSQVAPSQLQTNQNPAIDGEHGPDSGHTPDHAAARSEEAKDGGKPNKVANGSGSSNTPAHAAAGAGAGAGDSKPTVAGGKALASSANLMRLLPTGAVLAFQTLATSFTNQGDCLPANWWLTLGLVTFLASTCVFFAFTDSVVYKDKVYHGVAVPGRLHVFDLPEQNQRHVVAELKKRRLKAVDWVHAFFTAVVFLTIAGSDVGLQMCFFKDASEDTKQLLRNLPLGMAVLSSFVFMIFPTTRKGIGFDNSEYSVIPEKGSEKGSSSQSQPAAGSSSSTSGGAAAGKGIMSSANLLQLLPAGAVLAFQALAATFTNQGNCHPANWWLTLGLVTFLTGTCIFFAFTDSVRYKDKIYHGVALPGRLYIFNLSTKEQKSIAGYLKKKGLKAVDWVHGIFTAVVFLTIAGNDVGLQMCFFKDASKDTKQLLKNLPLGMAVLSSFVFMIFPPTRKGMGFDDSDYNVIEKVDDNHKVDKRKDDPENPPPSSPKPKAPTTS